ncbi:MAG: hypothetical protein KDE56_04820 [Anaerolineales bacterium]|nr:hypothetical protein [Anaerolineales bacterium]
MGPLVYYCRWQGAKLRLRGRDETAVWGHLVFQENNQERTQFFRYQLAEQTLTLNTDTGEQTIQLDKMGVAVS